jgi:hypothetical protein
VLKEMRTSGREIFYLVGTPRSKVRQYEKKWLDLPWQKVRESVDVKFFTEDGELYVLAKSEGRRAKETCGGKSWLACCVSCELCSAAVRDGISCCYALALQRKKRAALFVSCTCNSRAKAKP